MQEIAKHESPWLAANYDLLILLFDISLLTFYFQFFLLFVLNIFSFSFPLNSIFPCLLIEFTLHQHVKEIAHTCLVSQLKWNVDGPEKWMLTRAFYIREGD